MGLLDGRSILLVEDAYHLAMDAKRALEGAGAEVVGPFAENAEAIAALETIHPDGAVIDINLGEGPSFDLARWLKARSTPFVFFTGYDEAAIPPEFADVVRLEKPVSDARLVRAVANQLPTPPQRPKAA